MVENYEISHAFFSKRLAWEAETGISHVFENQ